MANWKLMVLLKQRVHLPPVYGYVLFRQKQDKISKSIKASRYARRHLLIYFLKNAAPVLLDFSLKRNSFSQRIHTSIGRTIIDRRCSTFSSMTHCILNHKFSSANVLCVILSQHMLYKDYRRLCKDLQTVLML